MIQFLLDILPVAILGGFIFVGIMYFVVADVMGVNDDDEDDNYTEVKKWKYKKEDKK
jgi:hypothetical protein